MNESIDRDALLSEIDAAFFKTDPTGEEQLGFLKCRRIIREAPAVDSVSRDEYDALLKRFRHLLESDFIRSFDEVDPRTQTYKRHISEANNVVPIVRCAECRHWLKRSTASDTFKRCVLFGCNTVRNFYCASGAKIDSEVDGR